MRFSQLAAVLHDDFLGGFAARRSVRLDFLHHIHTVGDDAEYDVLAVQPGRLHCRQEELAAVGVGTSVGHRQDSRASVLQREVLVFEFVTINRFATSAVVVGEVTALAHEIRNDSVEGATTVSKTFFTSAQGAEVLGCSWNDVTSQFHSDASNRRIIGGHIEKHSG